MNDQQEVVRPLYAQRVVFAETPAVVRALEQRAAEHGRSVAAELRGLVRRYLDDEESPEVIRYLLPGRGAAREAKRLVVDPSTPISELCICSRRLLDSVAGGCEVGRILRWDDPRVLAAPEAFEPLMLRLER